MSTVRAHDQRVPLIRGPGPLARHREFAESDDLTGASMARDGGQEVPAHLVDPFFVVDTRASSHRSSSAP